MHIMHKLLMTLILLLGQSAYALKPEGPPNKSPDSSSSKFSCPAKDFSLFILKFSDDEIVQRLFTQYPLIKQQLDPNAEPEPKKVIRKLRREQIQFPVMPKAQERAQQSLEIRIISANAVNAQVNLIKPDTDHQVSYFFKKNGCWLLVRIEDWSL